MGGVDVTVRRARDDEAADAARALAESHENDPGMVQFFPDGGTRARALRQVFRLTVADALGFGHVYVALANDRIIGTAAWLPPGEFPPHGARRAFASVPYLSRILWISPRSFRSFMAFSMSAARQVRGQTIWFLAGLGVVPTAQQAGIGGRLMQTVLARADAARQTCVLNTQNEANLAYYRRFGFEVSVNAWHAANGPTSWTMRRPPGAVPG